MKFFTSEYLKDYNTYTFSYANYAEWEPGDDFLAIYSRGYLPYTGDLSLDRHIFYMARSIRVDTEQFSLNSENRRILRRLEPYHIEVHRCAREDFDYQDEGFRSLCLTHAQERFSNDSMQNDRLDYVLSRAMNTDVLIYKIDGETVGYVLICLDEGMMHYWFAFFDLEWMQRLPIGKWMMLESIRWASNEGVRYVYLGTCYGAKSLYKVRDFKGIEFWDGGSWRTDVAVLKQWCKEDETPLPVDRFKLS